VGVGAGLYMYDVVVKKFTFAISSLDEFLYKYPVCQPTAGWLGILKKWLLSTFHPYVVYSKMLSVYPNSCNALCIVKSIHKRKAVPNEKHSESANRGLFTMSFPVATDTSSSWPPYWIGQIIIFLSCGFFFLSFFFPRLISAVADWMFTILLRMIWP